MPDATPPVSLREITRDNLGAVLALSVAESQKGFVASNAVSLAQAHFAPEAWYRAIYHGDEPVGFVMLEDQSRASPPPEKPEIGVWRFMIDQRFQGRGIGRAALEQVIEHVRRMGRFSSLLLSYVPGPGSPEGFYRGLGFRPNGRMDGDEVVMELPLPLTEAPSQQRAAAPAPPVLQGIDHVHVYVADRAAAEAWYERVLGLTRVPRLAWWAADGGPLTLSNAADTVHIALFERPPQACRSTIAFGVSAAQFEAWREHLAAALGREPEIEDHKLSWSLYFKDPDGNPYEITTYEYDRVSVSRKP